MTLEARLEVERLPDYRWLDNGQSVLGGALLALDRQLDQRFVRWGSDFQAAEYVFPACIPARELARLDYLRAFPHLATFPTTLAPDTPNLQRFVAGESVDTSGAVQLTTTLPVRDVLTPAACYHCYIHFQGTTLTAPLYLTTRNTCFRREAHYTPLQRQWSFAMREIVCIGSADEVLTFLGTCRERIQSFVQALDLPITWQAASDPFFDPTRDPKYLLQKLEPVKTELCFPNGLALGSVNFHRNYFGTAFQIRRGLEAAFSGCVAFGLERWLFAWLMRFGYDAAQWPQIDRV
jgi:seryl-tRNA synthetase